MVDVVEIGLGRWWKSKGTLLVAFVVVGGIGIALGRWSRGPMQEAKGASLSAASSSAASLGGDGGGGIIKQHFDLKELSGYTTGSAIREMDRDIFAALADPNLQRKALVDLFPSRPYRVKVSGDVDEHRYALVLIDMNRSGKWDERWTLKGDEVFRLLPQDPAAGGEPVQFTLAHGRWQAH